MNITHLFTDISCNWENEELHVTEGEDTQVELYATCRGKYSSSFFLPVSCVPYNVPGVVSPGLYAIVVPKSGVHY